MHKTNHSEEDKGMANKIRKGYLVKINRQYKDKYNKWHEEVIYEGRCTKNGAYISVFNIEDEEEIDRKSFKSKKAAINYMAKRGYNKNFNSDVEKVEYALAEVVL